MDAKKIVDRKLSFMRMKPNIAKAKPSVASQLVRAPSKPQIPKLEEATISSIASPEVQLPPILEEGGGDVELFQDIKPLPPPRKGFEGRDSGAADSVSVVPAVGSSGAPTFRDLKPVPSPRIPSHTDAERPMIANGDAPRDRGDSRAVPYGVRSPAFPHSPNPAPKRSAGDFKSAFSCLMQPVASVDAEALEEEDEIEEISADKDPMENIMIIKRRSGNGKLKKRRAESKLADWRKLAKTKLKGAAEENVTMRDLIFFKPSREKKDTEKEDENPDQIRDDFFADDPFASAGVDEDPRGITQNAGPVKAERVDSARSSQALDAEKSKENTATPAASSHADVGNGENASPSTNDATVVEEGVDSEMGVGAPKVKIGADGSIVLDEESLVVRSTASKDADKIKSAPVVLDDANVLFVSEDRRKLKKEIVKTKEWTITALAVFYKALSIVGTDFSMMEELFKGTRSRKELKLKYRMESRRNPDLVNKALTGKNVRFDLALLPEFLEEPETEEGNKKRKAPRKKKEPKPRPPKTPKEPKATKPKRVKGENAVDGVDGNANGAPKPRKFAKIPQFFGPTLDSIPTVSGARAYAARKRKRDEISSGSQAGIDLPNLPSPAVPRNNIASPSSSFFDGLTPHPSPVAAVPVPASPCPAEDLEDSGKTFAELRTAGSRVPEAQVVAQHNRVRTLSSSGPATPAPTPAPSPAPALPQVHKIVIVATKTECPVCPMYHLYANDKQNLNDAQLKEAIAEAMRRVQALRSRNAALPSSKHSPNCSVAKMAAARALAKENFPGLFSTFGGPVPPPPPVRASTLGAPASPMGPIGSPGSPRVVAVRRLEPPPPSPVRVDVVPSPQAPEVPAGET